MPGLTPEEELVWIQQAYNDTKKEDLVTLGATDAIRKLLAAPDTKDYGVYKFADVEIRHKKYPTGTLRRLLTTAKTALKGSEDPMRMQDKIIYQALSEMCIDNPWNNPLSWAKIDAGTNDGRVYKIFMDIMTKIGGGEKALQSFQ
jgi:hypothetical protein